MRRVLLLSAGVALLALAVLAAPAPAPRPGATLLQEVGRSLGGLGVLASDVLYLRAERLREEGRLEEVAPLYRVIQDLEPDAATAADFLVALQAFDLVADAPDAAARLRRWETAWELLERARARHPDDPSLRVREADLLLEVPAHHPDLADPIEARVGDRRRRAVLRLMEAAEQTDVLPWRGRHHLLLLTELLPVFAWQALEAEPGREAPFLDAGDRLLRLRGERLAQMPWVGTPDGEALVTVPRDRYLRLGLEAVRTLAREGKAALPRVRAALAQEVPDAPLVRALGAP